MTGPRTMLASVMAAMKSKRNPLGAGRSPRAGEAAAHKVTIRLTDSERVAYRAAAEAQGVTVGDWIRAACAMCLPKRKVIR